MQVLVLATGVQPDHTYAVGEPLQFAASVTLVPTVGVTSEA